MNQIGKLEVIDKNGWQKIYLLEKNIVYIGSQRRSENDIVLEQEHGGGVASLHVQLIAANGDHAGYKLVNLANEDILLRSAGGDQTLSPRAVVNLADGTTFVLGEFTLVFHAGEGSPGGLTGSSSSGRIGLSLAMPQTQLAPNQSLEGTVTVRNLGDQAGAQFELDLEGLDPDCYDILPGPLLSSGAEKEVFFHLHHRGAKPLAGDCNITVRATAPRAYPGEQATVSQMIRVIPFYRHRLRLAPPGEVGTPPQVEEDLLTPKAITGPRPQTKERLKQVAQA